MRLSAGELWLLLTRDGFQFRLVRDIGSWAHARKSFLCIGRRPLSTTPGRVYIQYPRVDRRSLRRVYACVVSLQPHLLLFSSPLFAAECQHTY